MTDERSALGARVAEAMGWEREECTDGCCVAYRDRPFGDPDATMLMVEAFTSWDGYGVVDAWMREQGYSRCTWRYPQAVSVAYYKPAQMMMDNMVTLETPDEPFAALQAVEKALEARE